MTHRNLRRGAYQALIAAGLRDREHRLRLCVAISGAVARERIDRHNCAVAVGGSTEEGRREVAVPVDLALGDERRRPAGALVEVEGAVGVVRGKPLEGREDDSRAVRRGVLEEGVEGLAAG
jgi:hypothetical protein